jgi:DNA-binding response OmpR family regulator
MLGDIVLDTVACTVSRGGEPVELSHREFGVLQQLMENPGRVMTRQRLEQHIYGWNAQVESNAIEVHVHHLRKKLGNDLIRTVRGVGYVIERTG